MLSCEHITLSFNSQIIFDDVSFLINRRDRIALIGKNGAGKTTLLRILNGEQEVDKGTVSKDKDLTIGYLPQMVSHSSNLSIQQDIVQSLTDKSNPTTLAEMDRMLIGLGFKREDFDKPCNTFSGGWLMRIELVKVLLQHPTLLLLDEPTNHLDIESIQWFEDFLIKSKPALLIVSHDKEFLNKVTTRTIEINFGHLNDYKVPYNEFVILRQERQEQQMRAYNNQQKLIKNTETFIERFRYKATKATQVQARIKQLSKIEKIEVEAEDASKLNIKFQPAPRSGDFPLVIKDLTKRYDDKTILNTVNMTIQRGEKVAFVGKNGEGKSTLVKCIMHQIPYDGSLQIGHNVKIGYFAQNQASLLDENLTVFQTVDNVAVGDVRLQLRNILGAFMFGGEAIDKKVKVLSGGERTRLAIVKLLLEPYNLLILDEPTNHLDIPSKDRLKIALQQFNGTLICVSHDRDFLNGLVDKIYEFANKKVMEHMGDIFQFLRNKKLNDLNELDQYFKYIDSNPKKEKRRDNPQMNYFEQKKNQAQQRKKEQQINKLEEEIAELESKIKEFETLFENTENQTPENISYYETNLKELQKKMDEWSTIADY